MLISFKFQATHTAHPMTVATGVATTEASTEASQEASVGAMGVGAPPQRATTTPEASAPPTREGTAASARRPLQDMSTRSRPQEGTCPTSVEGTSLEDMTTSPEDIIDDAFLKRERFSDR